MRKLIYFGLILSLFFYCGSKQEKIERIMENGVEVIVNHLEPYQVKDGPTTLTLEEECVIDTEREDLTDLGISEIGAFDIDSEGNVYFISSSQIFKFDKKGNFVKTFGKEGQGPGEFQRPANLGVNSKGEIAVTDIRNYKISFFQRDGTLIKEIKIKLLGIEDGVPLENGNYLFMQRKIEASAEKLEAILSLFDSNFKKIKQLDKREFPNPAIGRELEATYHNLVWSLSKDKIFTGTQDRGYDINAYDFEGNLLRKIRKGYKRILTSGEYKKKYMKQFEAPLFDPIRDRFYFPKSMPPFHYFLTDEEGRIFVMTYEEGENSDEYVFDIFNPEGVFICRKNLKDFSKEAGLKGKFKNNRLYCVYEKESGFEKLVAYKVIWKK